MLCRILHALQQERLHNTDMVHKLQRERQEFIVGVGSKQPVIDDLKHTKQSLRLTKSSQSPIFLPISHHLL